MPEPSILTFAITTFVKLCRMELLTCLYCPSEEMKADLLTKPLPRERFKMLCEAMGMVELLHKQPVN